ncbi:hypothetical protein AVEN_85097-1 [Araneus ventricosus]|uniref:Uncharacterized protein n=1 Tax=Araneus ventricosus TaxID=182803 RepID=A0A4Y2SG34_ARAVE|nr:hypothetical protein AVEN_85097-1 [Araneus ventricosus]
MDGETTYSATWWKETELRRHMVYDDVPVQNIISEEVPGGGLQGIKMKIRYGGFPEWPPGLPDRLQWTFRYACLKPTAGMRPSANIATFNDALRVIVPA